MKEIELKLIAELMKNSRRSDRELAKAIGASQPTVTRIRGKLEKEGFIREYTMIPYFTKLGFEIMALTFIKFTKELSEDEIDRLQKATLEMERKIPPSSTIMMMNGIGLGFDNVVVSFHGSFTSLMQLVKVVKQLPFVDISHFETFAISLADKRHYQPLTFSALAKYLLTLGKERS